MNASIAMKQYGAVSRDAAVEGSDAHNLIMLLMKGSLESISQAKGALQQGNIELRGKRINRATQIILGLKEFLNVEQGGELPKSVVFTDNNLGHDWHGSAHKEGGRKD